MSYLLCPVCSRRFTPGIHLCLEDGTPLTDTEGWPLKVVMRDD